MNLDPDAGLVAEAQQGNQKAYAELIKRHYDMLYAVVFGVLNHREAALDVVQEVFMKISQELTKFQGKSKFKTWLYRIGVNAAIDARRRLRPMESIDATDISDEEDVKPLILIDETQNPRTDAQSEEVHQLLMKALDQMSVGHKTVLMLREWQGLSYEEIAETLQVEIGTVMSRLFYARKQLVQILGPQFKECIL